MAQYAYPTLVFVHLLLFVLWLGADVGVFVLGQHFRKRHVYSLDQRLALLKLLVLVDMTPRTAWALMVPVSLSVARMGGWWAVPLPIVGAAYVVAALWLWLIWNSHVHEGSPRAARNRRIELPLKLVILTGYLGVGVLSLATGAPIVLPWLAAKATLFGLIFAAAIMIDVAFKPIGPLLNQLIAHGSRDEIEQPLLRVMNRTRIWVWCVYGLLLATAWLGVVKPA